MPSAPAGSILNSLPNAGTHLLHKALTLMPGVAEDAAAGAIERTTADRFAVGEAGDAGEARATVPVYVDGPQPVPIAQLAARLAGLGPGRFSVVHIPRARAVIALLARVALKSLSMLRGPRD